MTKGINLELQERIIKYFNLSNCEMIRTEKLATDEESVKRGEGKTFQHSVLQCDGGRVDVDQVIRDGKNIIGLFHNNQEKEFELKVEGELKFTLDEYPK